MDIPVDELDISVNREPARTSNYENFIIGTFLFIQIVARMFNAAAIRHEMVAPLGRLWANNHPPQARALEEEVVGMPPSTLGFIVTSLLTLVDIKSQGNPEFPCETHPQTIMVSVTSLIMYGLVSAAELAVSGAGIHPTSIYAVIARLGRIGCLCILIVSLLSLFYS